MKRTHLYALAALLVLASTGVLLGAKLITFHKQPGSFDKVEDLLEWEADTLLSDPHYAQQFIRTGPPELRYNCHGWTFARGQRTVIDDEVKDLLNSDRFRKVSVPMSGDIVVYYDKTGDLCHSGIVKATGRQSFVLVESKWGGAGRFLHMLDLPQVQARHEFYRRNYPGSRLSRTN